MRCPHIGCLAVIGRWLEGILDALAVYEGIYLPPHGNEYKRMKDALRIDNIAIYCRQTIISLNSQIPVPVARVNILRE
ncbi:hypothetical protein Pyn_39144 [Prunus yedoensis var. nudiflora]|uniref:Uncharacterized protein n=1 Tax=Prunus yedoensis var. nudiflora TaxID=2094558 RepID=A0A314Z3P3_PRUYE|nr:hypothetical protein Pyn_39144 [Prunus yedoensis var. nudiflora]